MQKEHIQKMIFKMENSLSGEVNIEKISHGSFISSAQLYRDFYSFTGHTVKEYIRKRRLSKALALVKHSDMSLAEITQECGYSSQQAFCKCVKAATGLTPLTYKQSDCYYYFPQYNEKHRQQIKVSSETIPELTCFDYFDFKLKGIENRAINKLINTLPDYKGRVFGKNGKQFGSLFCYELYIESCKITGEALTDAGLANIRQIPDAISNFAKTTVKNNEAEINAAWDYIYTEWLNTSMFEQSDQKYFEEYIIKDKKINRLVLYLPVSRRKDYNKILITDCDEMLFLVSRKAGINSEEISSRKVMSFLSENYPYIVKSVRQFYVDYKQHPYSKQTEYTCGVKVKKILDIPRGGGVEMIHFDKGKYAVLEGACCGDSSVYKKVLSAWLNENGFEPESDLFTVYETDGTFEENSIVTRVLCKLKNDKN